MIDKGPVLLDIAVEQDPLRGVMRFPDTQDARRGQDQQFTG